jgi:hypothetical protein
MAIVGMELFQFALKSINVHGGEIICRRRREESQTFWLTGGFKRLVTSSPTFYQPMHDVQHVQHPTASRGFDFADGFEPGVTGANLGGSVGVQGF